MTSLFGLPVENLVYQFCGKFLCFGRKGFVEVREEAIFDSSAQFELNFFEGFPLFEEVLNQLFFDFAGEVEGYFEFFL